MELVLYSCEPDTNENRIVLNLSFFSHAYSLWCEISLFIHLMLEHLCCLQSFEVIHGTYVSTHVHVDAFILDTYQRMYLSHGTNVYNTPKCYTI